ncbi:uncharacterized protein DS421_20g693740 [Arachis hypogaea]|nr:uncharacterized protein DS421_20g693740 [Arachis hypogaea]
MRVSPSPAANILDGRILPVAGLPVICQQDVFLPVVLSHTVKLVATKLVAAVVATGPIPRHRRPAIGGTPTRGQAWSSIGVRIEPVNPRIPPSAKLSTGVASSKA